MTKEGALDTPCRDFNNFNTLVKKNVGNSNNQKLNKNKVQPCFTQLPHNTLRVSYTWKHHEHCLAQTTGIFCIRLDKSCSLRIVSM